MREMSVMKVNVKTSLFTMALFGGITIYIVGLFVLPVGEVKAEDLPKSKIDQAYEAGITRFSERLCLENAQHYQQCYGLGSTQCAVELSAISTDCFFDSSKYKTRDSVNYLHVAEGITDETVICIDVNLTNSTIDSNRVYVENCSD
jgi:hypothetical protein